MKCWAVHRQRKHTACAHYLEVFYCWALDTFLCRLCKVSVLSVCLSLQADKHAITQQLGVQLRDLRLLDPQLHNSYPSALLCRDKALVVNLEHIKCIITKDEVLILNADEENVVGVLTYRERGCVLGEYTK